MKKILVGNRCPMCQKMNSVEVYKADFEKWRNGELIQVAMPYLSADDREIIKTGICPTCWDRMFSFPENDEEEDFEEPEDDDWGNEFDDMVEEDIDAFLEYILG